MLLTQALLQFVSSLDSIHQKCHPTRLDIFACPLQLAYPFQEQIKVEMRPQAGYMFHYAEMRSWLHVGLSFTCNCHMGISCVKVPNYNTGKYVNF